MYAGAPAWSPDGTRFTFALRGEDGAEALYVADANGEGARLVETGGLPAGASYWSPDGSAIAFHAAVDDSWAVFVVPVDGGEVVKLSD